MVSTMNVKLEDQDNSEICNSVLFHFHIASTNDRNDFTFKCDASYLFPHIQWPLIFSSRCPDSLRKSDSR